MSIEELEKKKAEALAKYASCGCTKYMEEARTYEKRIIDLKAQSNG